VHCGSIGTASERAWSPLQADVGNAAMSAGVGHRVSKT
jgi:hypothetical protein